MSLAFTPVIIIGAGRSGTNMLRNSICELAEFSTWDCDEINPIWRHGNGHVLHDALTPGHATDSVKKFIRKRFINQWIRLGKPDYLVEKTCANSLRVSFVEEIFPEAKFVYIVRNGADAALSATKRWQGKMEIPALPYYLSKIRNTPLSDLPLFGGRFLKSRLDMLLGRKQQLSFWGPQFPEMHSLSKSAPLLELCCHQWVACVQASDSAFAAISTDRWTKVRYEDFVATPQACLQRIVEFLGVCASAEMLSGAVGNISVRSVGNARDLSCKSVEEIARIIDKTMLKHGYSRKDG
jgi:hypothetical protein